MLGPRLKRNVFNRIFNVALGLFLSGTIRMRQMKSNLGELTVRNVVPLPSSPPPLPFPS